MVYVYGGFHRPTSRTRVTKIAFIGASQLVGTKVLKDLSDNTDYEALGTYLRTQRPGLKQLDVADRKAVHDFVDKKRPDVVIVGSNPGAKACQQNPDLVNKVIVEGTRNVLDAVSDLGSTVVLASSDYVWSGRKQGEYTEDDPCDPLSVYGKVKARAEELVVAYPKGIVLRLSGMYGYNGANHNNGFVGWLLGKGNVSVGNRQKKNELFVDDVSRVLYLLLSEDPGKLRFGVFNVGGARAITKYDLAEALAKSIPGIGNINTHFNLSGDYPVPETVEMDIGKLRSIGFKSTSLSYASVKIAEQIDRERAFLRSIS